jgi:hypothetical protein
VQQVNSLASSQNLAYKTLEWPEEDVSPQDDEANLVFDAHKPPLLKISPKLCRIILVVAPYFWRLDGGIGRAQLFAGAQSSSFAAQFSLSWLLLFFGFLAIEWVNQCN